MFKETMTKIVLSKRAAANILNLTLEELEVLIKNKHLVTLTMQEVYEYKKINETQKQDNS